MSTADRDAAAIRAIITMTDHDRKRALLWISGADLPLAEAGIRFAARDRDRELSALLDLVEASCQASAETRSTVKPSLTGHDDA